MASGAKYSKICLQWFAWFTPCGYFHWTSWTFLQQVVSRIWLVNAGKPGASICFQTKRAWRSDGKRQREDQGASPFHLHKEYVLNLTHGRWTVNFYMVLQQIPVALTKRDTRPLAPAVVLHKHKACACFNRHLCRARAKCRTTQTHFTTCQFCFLER